MAPAPTFDELIQAVHDRSPDETPEERLATAAALNGEVTALADVVLGHFVEQARQAGTPWSKIGDALGVTKQGAQQRFVDHPVEPPDDLGAIGGLGSRLTPRAHQAISAARDAADALGHSYVGTEHLLLGAVVDPDGLAAKAMAALGVGADVVEAEVRRRVGTGAAPEGTTPAEAAPDAGRRPFTPRARRVLDLAMSEALKLGHDYVGTEHLLLALARESDGVAAVVLTELGCTTESIRAEVVALLSGYRPPG